MYTCVWWWYYEMNAWARKCKRDAGDENTKVICVSVYTYLRGVRWEILCVFHTTNNNNNNINLKAKENKKTKLRGKWWWRRKNIERMRKYENLFKFFFLFLSHIQSVCCVALFLSSTTVSSFISSYVNSKAISPCLKAEVAADTR